MYLYGGVSGMGAPTGINPNCILYNARESYKFQNIIERTYYGDFDEAAGQPGGLAGIPPGLTPGLFPNYYQSHGVKTYWIGPYHVCTATHIQDITITGNDTTCVNTFGPSYSGNQIQFQIDKLFANYASTQGSVELPVAGWLSFWDTNSSFSETIDYSLYAGRPYEFVETPYEHSTEKQVYSGVNTSNCPVLSDSFIEETLVPGTTFYRVTNRWDFGLIKFYENPGQAPLQPRDPPYMRTLSLYSCLNKEERKNIKNYIVRNLPNDMTTVANFTLETQRKPKTRFNDYFISLNKLIVPVKQNDTYCFIGANQTVFKIPKNGYVYYSSTLVAKNPLTYTSFLPLGIDIKGRAATVGGDSSGLLCRVIDNEIFGLGMLTGGGISNTSLNNEVYPLMQYLIDQEIPITYYYSNTDEKQVATKKQFDVLQEKLTSTLTKIQNAYQNLVG